MAAMGGEPVPPPPPAATTPAAPEAQRQARYNYLVGRLRSRQITMEEATELFTQMQAMLRASEATRRANLAAPPPSAPGPVPSHPRAVTPTPSGGSDDLFLVGLLAMGAGAGLLAAMARRVGDANPPAAPATKGSIERRSS